MKKPERYTPPNFHFICVLYTIDDEPKIVREAVDSKESKLKKKTMVEEIEAWDLIEFPARRKYIGSKWVCKISSM